MPIRTEAPCRHIRRAAAWSLIWMAKRCRAAELQSLLGARGLFLNSTRKPPCGGPVFHITPLSGNAGRSPRYPSVVFCLLMLALCGKAWGSGRGFLFIAVLQRFVSLVEAKFVACAGTTCFFFLLRSVRDLLECFCRPDVC